MTFLSLCKTLKLPVQATTLDNLKLIKTWVHKHLSQDACFTGDATSQLAQYTAFAQAYCQDLVFKDKQGVTVDMLFTAASEGYDKLIADWSLSEVPINDANVYGMTALHMAAVNGHVATTKVLLEKGANFNSLNQYQQNPLFSALSLPIIHSKSSKPNKIKIFQLIAMQPGCHIEQQDDSGNTIMHMMAAQDYANLISTFLQTYPKLAYIANHHSHYPIHTALLNNHLASLKRLLQVENSLLLADNKGWTALHYAAAYGRREALSLILSQNAKIDVPDALGQTPVMLAASTGNLSIIKALLQKGADLNSVDSSGFTLLHHAVHGGHPDIVAWLLEHTKVDPKAMDMHQHTPMQLSQLEGRGNITTVLMKKGLNHRVNRHHGRAS